MKRVLNLISHLINIRSFIWIRLALKSFNPFSVKYIRFHPSPKSWPLIAKQSQVGGPRFFRLIMWAFLKPKKAGWLFLIPKNIRWFLFDFPLIFFCVYHFSLVLHFGRYISMYIITNCKAHFGNCKLHQRLIWKLTMSTINHEHAWTGKRRPNKTQASVTLDDHWFP